jgi:hypothetical protein
MFRIGGKNPHTVYWSEQGKTDRFVCVAMSRSAARAVVHALNTTHDPYLDTLLTSLPIVPARGNE